MFALVITVALVLVAAALMASLWQKLDEACGERDTYKHLCQGQEKTIRELERRIAAGRKALDGEGDE